MSATQTRCKQGQRVELGRYETPSEKRILVGQRIDGVVRIDDWPRDGRGRRYFVEAGFDSKAELAVLVADYRRQAKRLGSCPMSREAIKRAFALSLAGPLPAQVRTP